MARKRWSDFSPQAKTAIVVGAAIEVVATTVALADLVRRPDRDVRGPKLLWAVACFVQPFGPFVYLRVGRRR